MRQNIHVLKKETILNNQIYNRKNVEKCVVKIHIEP